MKKKGVKKKGVLKKRSIRIGQEVSVDTQPSPPAPVSKGVVSRKKTTTRRSRVKKTTPIQKRVAQGAPATKSRVGAAKPSTQAAPRKSPLPASADTPPQQKPAPAAEAVEAVQPKIQPQSEIPPLLIRVEDKAALKTEEEVQR
ncbi:MAG: hypothetical protein HQL48_07675, partial [Gammaproteobacteria bacterium]|nr:hypothetical protein [Gammaproteobacteria bacterium]